MSIDGYNDVPKSDESALRKAVSQQPVSVAICATELQFYNSGTYRCCTPDPAPVVSWDPAPSCIQLWEDGGLLQHGRCLMRMHCWMAGSPRSVR